MATYDDKPKRGVIDFELADLGTRLIALIIDGVILGLITGLLFAGARNAGGFLGFVIGVLYQWYFLTQQNGQTPGKRVMGIRVIKVNGAPLQAADVIVRYIGYYINSIVFGLGWIWALFDKDKQGWHDKLAGTYVVKA
ncbi:MAG: RDD family protein [Chloroflexi bacterium]|nr:RDD family protein [Chloroflexota bacterium]